MMLISTKKKRSKGDEGVGVVLGHSLKGPKRVCAAEKGMVFGVSVLNKVYNLTVSPLKEYEGWR